MSLERTENILRLEKVNTFYGETHILKDVSMEVARGRLTLVLGRNGMGKTTTVHSIVGFCQVRSGRIRFKSADIEDLPSYERARLGIGLIPQGRRIFTSLTCEENLNIAFKGTDLRNSLEEVFAMFPVLKKRFKLKAGVLSGGEQQMLGIARMLLGKPELCLMDEPFEGLAPLIIAEISATINELKRKGFSILLVHPNISVSFEDIDYVYLFHKGEIVHHSSSQAFLGNKSVIERYLGIAEKSLR